MNARIVFAVLSLLVASAGAQDKYLCKHGHIRFFSHTPVEDIEAHNTEAASVINTVTGEVMYQVLIKSFTFKRALMEEHFNENYMESDMYPKSHFKGLIVNMKDINFSKPGLYKAVIKGDLTIHNKTNCITQTGTIEVRDGKLFAKAKFSIVPQDYGIEIPATVRDKIAKAMDVTVDMAYEPYKK